MKRENLIAAMNRKGRTPHSAETQELTLLLFDLAEEYAKQGLILGYFVADDSPIFDVDGNEVNNLAIADEEMKTYVSEAVRADVDAGRIASGEGDVDIAAIPAQQKDGGEYHILLEIFDPETRAIARHWVSRDEIMQPVRSRSAKEGEKRQAIMQHVEVAKARCVERVPDKQRRQFLESHVSLGPLVDGSIEERKTT